MEMKRHVKLYKSGKVWLAAAIFAVGVGAGVVNVPTFNATPQIVQAATNDLVTAKDANGNVSIDPTNTAAGAVAITPTNAADYFTASSKAGNTRAITGNTVQLTTGHESEANGYADGVALMLANQQIDFKSDFSMNLTMNINYDGSTMNGWVPGDGTALFFQPLDAATSLSSADTGWHLGVTKSESVANDALISFNISSNALKQLSAYTQNEWIIYESNKNVQVPIDTPLATGVVVPHSSTGSVSYTYDMTYKASTRTLTTVVSDANGNKLQTWNYQVPDSWSNTGYTMGVSASTAASHGAYQAVLNSYSYTPAGTTMSIQSTGLPAGTTGYSQSDIAAIAGNVVAFYPAGTTAPTTDASGQPVTTAIAVPAVGDYVLKQPQFLTVSTDDSKNVATLAFGKPSTVNVKYVDEAGNTIKAATSQNGFSGDQYSVTAPTVDGYTYSSASSALSGKYTDDSQTITLTYTKDKVAAGGLTINYVDSDGKQIQPSTTQSGNVGDAYNVDTPAIDGYTYAKLGNDSTALSGSLTADAQSVTLVYTKNPVQSGGVTVNYVDTDGNTIKSSTTQSGHVGDAYNVDTPEIDGYTYSQLGKNSAALAGAMTADTQTVTLVYTKNPVKAGGLTINYVDADGNQIQSPTTQNGNVGDAYNVDTPLIAGYTYSQPRADSAALSGTLTAESQAITLVYNKNVSQLDSSTTSGPLTIKYVDQNGKSIRDDTVKTGFVGNGYGVTPPAIGAYTYQGLGSDSAALTGKFTAGTQTITLVYQQNHGQDTTPTAAGDLTIKYVDQNGKSIRDDIVKSGYVGNGYGVTPPAIGAYTYQGLGSGSAALTGKFTAGAQTITLVYQQNRGEETTPITAGDLTIKYVDENGQSIRTDTVKNGYVGNGYGVTPPTISGYTYQSLGEDSAALSGKFTDDAQTMTLVYRRDTTGSNQTTDTDTTTPTDGSSTKDDSTTDSSRGTLPDTNADAESTTSAKAEQASTAAKAAKTQQRHALPQTGEETKRGATIIGALLLSLISVLGIWKHQRKA